MFLSIHPPPRICSSWCFTDGIMVIHHHVSPAFARRFFETLSKQRTSKSMLHLNVSGFNPFLGGSPQKIGFPEKGIPNDPPTSEVFLRCRFTVVELDGMRFSGGWCDQRWSLEEDGLPGLGSPVGSRFTHQFGGWRIPQKSRFLGDVQNDYNHGTIFHHVFPSPGSPIFQVGKKHRSMARKNLYQTSNWTIPFILYGPKDG